MVVWIVIGEGLCGVFVVIVGVDEGFFFILYEIFEILVVYFDCIFFYVVRICI